MDNYILWYGGWLQFGMLRVHRDNGEDISGVSVVCLTCGFFNDDATRYILSGEAGWFSSII